MALLTGKISIVTGAAHGIGAAIAERFVREGANVIIADINEDAGRQVADRIGALFRQVDVSQADQVQELVEFTQNKLGGLDIIVSNACIHSYEMLENTSMENWNTVLGSNLTPTFCLANKAVPYLKRRPGSSILIIASIMGIRGYKQGAAYTSAKGGQLALMRQLAAELAPNIRVNAISPGTILSNPEKTSSSSLKKFEAKHPLGRMGLCEDVANAAAFLSSSEASYINAHNLVVDGGYAVLEQ